MVKSRIASGDERFMILIPISTDALEAAARILDEAPGHPYGTLRISGDPKIYKQFYKDVKLIAEALAEIGLRVAYHNSHQSHQ